MNNNLLLTIGIKKLKYDPENGDKYKKVLMGVCNYNINSKEYKRLDKYSIYWSKNDASIDEDVFDLREVVYYNECCFAELRNDSSNISLFELIQFEELRAAYGDMNQIRKFLYKGFELPSAISSKFLIVIDESKLNYEVLECKKTQFIKNGNYYQIEENNDMTKNEFIFQYSIDKKDLINIENLGSIKHRIIYNKSILPYDKRKFRIRTIESYALPFLNYFFRKNKDSFELTNKDINKFNSIIKNEYANTSDIETFLKEKSTFYFSEEEINAINNKVIELFLNLSKTESDPLLKNMIILSPEVKRKCFKTWTRISDEKKIKKQNELISLKKEKENIELLIKQLKKDQDEAEISYERIAKQNEEMEKKREQLNISFEADLQSYRTDLSKLVKTQILTGLNTKSEKNTNFFVVNEENPKTDSMLENIGNIEELYTALCTNSGLEENEDLSLQYIIPICTAILSKKHLIMSGEMASYLTRVLSITIDGCDPCNIYIPSQNHGALSVELIQRINSINHHVIVIDGILDAMDENLYYALIKYCPSKTFVFTINNNDALDLLSLTIYTYSLYLDDLCFEPLDGEEAAPTIIKNLAKLRQELEHFEIKNTRNINYEMVKVMKSRAKRMAISGLQKNIYSTMIKNIEKVAKITNNEDNQIFFIPFLNFLRQVNHVQDRKQMLDEINCEKKTKMLIYTKYCCELSE